MHVDSVNAAEQRHKLMHRKSAKKKNEPKSQPGL